MTFLTSIDLMARGGAIALLTLWSWLLLRDHRSNLPARLAVTMSTAICCYIIVTAGWYRTPMLMGFVLALGAGATPGLFWLFAKAWFNDETQLRLRDLALVAASIANTAVVQLTFPSDGWINTLSGIIFRLAMLGFAGGALWAAWRGRDGDLVEGRRRLRTRLVFVVGLYVILIALTEIAAHRGWISHDRQHVMGSFAVVIIFAFCAAMFGMRQLDLFAPAFDAPRQISVQPVDETLTQKLLAHMQNELPHRDEDMTIARLAAQLGEQEYRLRRHINGALGHRNFAAFLNGYRLAEVKAALADPMQKEVPIITIALDAGFGSLGPFNRAFREAEGMTPSEYRARAGD
jgi:AraC-like DNA-binding protein